MSIAHKSPIVNKIVFNAIREFHFKKFKFSDKETVDTDIVPRIHPSIMQKKGFHESVYQDETPKPKPMMIPAFHKPKQPEHILQKRSPTKPPIPVKQQKAPEHLKGFQESIINSQIQTQEKTITTQQTSILNRQPMQQKPLLAKQINTQQVVETRPLPSPPKIIPINLFQTPPNYGKMNMIVRDPFVEFIECEGPDKNLIVTKRGQKQKTNISLTKQEIDTLLNNISAKTRIPLVTGVYRVSWDNMVINAVVSDSVSQRFLIKKSR